MAARRTWTDAEVQLLLDAENVVTLYHAGEPAVSEGTLRSASGARELAAELGRARSLFLCSERGVMRDCARRVLKGCLARFRRAERADEWLRRQLEGLGKERA